MTGTSIVLINTNYTNTNTTIGATSADKSLSPTEKIGMGVGISIAILLLVGCCYFGCVYSRRPKETEKIDRLPSQVQRRPSQVQAERRPSRRGSQLELRAIVAPLSKV
jgi:hypothetical protein